MYRVLIALRSEVNLALALPHFRITLTTRQLNVCQVGLAPYSPTPSPDTLQQTPYPCGLLVHSELSVHICDYRPMMTLLISCLAT